MSVDQFEETKEANQKWKYSNERTSKSWQKVEGVCNPNPPGTCRNLPEPPGTNPESPGTLPGTYLEPTWNHPEPSRNSPEPWQKTKIIKIKWK